MTPEANKEAIKHAYDTIFKTFENLDFRAAANCITADCDYITFNGMHLQGREAYLQSHEEMMNNFMFRGAKLEGQLQKIRFVNDTTAIVIATGAIRFRWQKKAPKSRQSINTGVWVKNEEGEWQLTAFHNCRIQKIPFIGRVMMMLTKKKKG
ncbi:hypothetical protein A3860_23835 [Niastella vici]|uniref:SnoaL-like domain-containing protein n=1 Tax=Niastella vici TaxID=1703345 RepID=A0A1V9FYH1_9BACT|nr:SgcJ/EcaC family oxidoreductase [Niastella vici]OQP63382.1 hypothetical protein A3860_23835 [Niastella vici]